MKHHPTSYATEPRQSHARATVSASSSSSNAKMHVTMTASAWLSVTACNDAVDCRAERMGCEYAATDAWMHAAMAGNAARRILGWKATAAACRMRRALSTNAPKRWRVARATSPKASAAVAFSSHVDVSTLSSCRIASSSCSCATPPHPTPHQLSFYPAELEVLILSEDIRAKGPE